jgi:hypothetical protein
MNKMKNRFEAVTIIYNNSYDYIKISRLKFRTENAPSYEYERFKQKNNFNAKTKISILSHMFYAHKRIKDTYPHIRIKDTYPINTNVYRYYIFYEPTDVKK